MLKPLTRVELDLLRDELQGRSFTQRYLSASLDSISIDLRTAEGVEMARLQGAAIVLAEILEISTPNQPRI